MGRLVLATAIALAIMVGGCGASAGRQPTIPQSKGLKDVRSPACTKGQLAQISSTTPTTRIQASERLGFLNTRKTAVRVQLDTLLVVTAKERDTGYLAVSTGCWVKRDSHIKNGVLTVALLMNHTGYPVLEHAAAVPAGAEDGGKDTYLHVVARH
jgi:hypothetical protein